MFPDGRVILIRHAESSGQEPAAELTARGRAQARDLAAVLRHETVARVVSSPFRRARETAEPLASGAGVHLDERLAEWQLPRIPPADWPQALRSILAGEAPLPDGVEPRDAARARGMAALQDAVAAADGIVALVTHGKLLALVLGALAGVDPFDVFTTLRNPHAVEVRTGGAGVEVRSLWPPVV